jgi:hypothetical protein
MPNTFTAVHKKVAMRATRKILIDNSMDERVIAGGS